MLNMEDFMNYVYQCYLRELAWIDMNNYEEDEYND